MLHNSGNQYVRAVGNSVDFELRSHKILVAQHGVFYLLRENYVHISCNIVFRKGNSHILTAYNVRRTQKYGITESFGCLYRLILGHYGNAFRTGNPELFQKRVKPFPVLGEVNAVSGSSEDAYSLFIEVTAKFDSRLTAERYYYSVRFFDIEHVLNVLCRQRFEIQPVRRIEVGRNGFGVIIDNNDFIAQLLQCPHAMNRRIIELYTLTYSYRTGAYNDNPAFFASADKLLSFIVFLIVISRIEIRCLRRKFRRTGINHFINGVSAEVKRITRKFFDFTIGITQLLTAEILLARDLFPADFLFVIGKIFEFAQKPLVYFRNVINMINRNPAFNRFIYYKQPLVGQFRKLFDNFVVGERRKFRQI